jgi:hypothetical protein
MTLVNASFTRTNGAMPASGTVYPRFFMDPVQDILASEQQGRPIFREEERVEIIMAGNPYSKPVFRVAHEHRERWPKEYEAFKKGQEIAPDGTPLEQWPLLKRAMVLELKALNFVTVEQLAAMSDHAAQQIPMYGRRLRELAQAYLDDAKAMALVTAATAANDRKDEEIAALRLQVESMASQMQTLFSQMQDRLNAPHPIATGIPGMGDPVEMARLMQSAPQAAQSSFADLPAAPRRRKVAEAAA